MQWTDIVQAVAAALGVAISIVSVFFVVISLRQAARAIESQNKSTDISSVLTIWDKLDDHWARYRSAKAADKEFEFGQLISYYETACSLFYHKTLTTAACRSLHEHLHEILPLMRRDPTLKTWFEKLKSTDSTFEYIRWFCDQPAPEKLS